LVDTTTDFPVILIDVVNVLYIFTILLMDKLPVRALLELIEPYPVL
jgi:hypothetical protein